MIQIVTTRSERGDSRARWLGCEPAGSVMTKEEWHRQQAELCRRLAWLISLRRDADTLRAMAEDHLRQAERLADTCRALDHRVAMPDGRTHQAGEG
jgi:hypothetical protein